MKKLFFAVLIISIFMLTFSCSKDTSGNTNEGGTTNVLENATTDNGSNTTATTNKWEYEPINLPENDFGGKAFNVITVTNSDNKPYLCFAAEEQNGDEITDALYKRNLAIEEKYNIKINEIQNDSPYVTAEKSILAGDNNYDIIIDYIANIRTMAGLGVLADLYNVPYIKDGINKP